MSWSALSASASAFDITRVPRRAVVRLFDALTDPLRRERTAAACIVGFVAAWTLYALIAKSSQDIHFDMGEMVAWSREVTLGTPKHPPLPAWLVRAWFSVFPLEDWSYYLFAILLASAALWIAWKASAPYLDGEKRLIGLALLTLVPFYNFQALKFNANTIMVPLWALTTWWFLRSYETRSTSYAVLAGLAAFGPKNRKMPTGIAASAAPVSKRRPAIALTVIDQPPAKLMKAMTINMATQRPGRAVTSDVRQRVFLFTEISLIFAERFPSQIQDDDRSDEEQDVGRQAVSAERKTQ